MKRARVQLTSSSCLSIVARALTIDPRSLSIDEDILPNLNSFGLDIWKVSCCATENLEEWREGWKGLGKYGEICGELSSNTRRVFSVRSKHALSADKDFAREVCLCIQTGNAEGVRSERHHPIPIHSSTCISIQKGETQMRRREGRSTHSNGPRS